MEKEKGERENDAKVMELTQRRDCCNFSVSHYSTRHVDGSYAFPFQQIRIGESMDRPWEMKTKSVSSASKEVGMGLPARKPLFLLLTPLAIITLLFLVLPLESVSPLFSLLPLSKRGR